jgi:hypothetical protein
MLDGQQALYRTVQYASSALSSGNLPKLRPLLSKRAALVICARATLF